MSGFYIFSFCAGFVYGAAALFGPWGQFAVFGGSVGIAHYLGHRSARREIRDRAEAIMRGQP